MAPLNVDDSVRHESIQLLCLVPNVKEWIHHHRPKGQAHIPTADVELAVADTIKALWQAMLSDVGTATHPDNGVSRHLVAETTLSSEAQLSHKCTCACAGLGEVPRISGTPLEAPPARTGV